MLNEEVDYIAEGERLLQQRHAARSQAPTQAATATAPQSQQPPPAQPQPVSAAAPPPASQVHCRTMVAPFSTGGCRMAAVVVGVVNLQMVVKHLWCAACYLGVSPLAGSTTCRCPQAPSSACAAAKAGTLTLWQERRQHQQEPGADAIGCTVRRGERCVREMAMRVQLQYLVRMTICSPLMHSSDSMSC